MKIRNVEIKARCENPQHVRDLLLTHGARHAGLDHQIDTYYETAKGRLKLRKGNIENALIAYARENISAPKLSNVILYQTKDAESLQEILDKALDTNIVVDKMRDIYFIGNVKFHIDEVYGLGTFVEIEAIDELDLLQESELRAQVDFYLNLLGISSDDLLTHSYSDMMLQSS